MRMREPEKTMKDFDVSAGMSFNFEDDDLNFAFGDEDLDLGLGQTPEQKPTPIPTQGIGSDLNFNQGQGSIPNQGQRPMPNQGPRPMPNQGPRPMPNQGPRPMPNQGPRPMPNQGPRPMPNQGPRPMPNQGQMPMPNQGQMPMPNQGPRPMPNQGQMPMPNQGPRPMPNQGRGSGPNQGQMPMPNQPQKRGKNGRPLPNRGQGGMQGQPIQQNRQPQNMNQNYNNPIPAKKGFNPLFIVIPLVVIILLVVIVVVGGKIVSGRNNVPNEPNPNIGNETVQNPVDNTPVVEPPIVEPPVVEPPITQEPPTEVGILDQKYGYENNMLGIKFNFDSSMYIRENVTDIFNTLKKVIPEDRDDFNIFTDKLEDILNVATLTTGKDDGLYISISILPFELNEQTTTLHIDGTVETSSEYISADTIPDEELISKYDIQIRENLEQLGCEIITYDETEVRGIGGEYGNNGNQRLRGIITSRAYSGSVDVTTSTGVVDILQCTIPLGRNALLITAVTDGRPIEIDKSIIFNQIIESLVIVTREPEPEVSSEIDVVT